MIINQSLAHGLEILLLYDTATSLLTVSEVSKRCGFSQSKTYRLIRTLTKYDLLKANPDTAQYGLGLNALRLGFLAQQHFGIVEIARPFMNELSVLTNETVLLTAVNGTKGVVLERVESQEPVRYSMFQQAAIIPLHCGASSKVLLAYLEEGEWETIVRKEGLERHTPNTITDEEQLRIHLREIRKKGYAFSDQECDQGGRAVAAPILDGLGRLVAGLSVAGPAYRMNRRKANSYAKLVIQYANKISSELD